jgi:hypothetical protein
VIAADPLLHAGTVASMGSWEDMELVEEEAVADGTVAILVVDTFDQAAEERLPPSAGARKCPACWCRPSSTPPRSRLRSSPAFERCCGGATRTRMGGDASRRWRPNGGVS